MEQISNDVVFTASGANKTSQANEHAGTAGRKVPAGSSLPTPNLLSNNKDVSNNPADAATASPPQPPTVGDALHCHHQACLVTSQCCHVQKQLLHKEKRVLAWRHAVSSSIPPAQHICYRLLQVLLVVPIVIVVLGVTRQHMCKKAMMASATAAAGVPGIDCSEAHPTLHYSSYVLAFLMICHVLLTMASVVLFCVFILPTVSQSSTWVPRDMMFFICKILGTVLNTVVQTLIAGSFVEFMTTKTFWLTMVITGTSYVATDLLYDFGEPPVGELWGPLGCLTAAFSARRKSGRTAGGKRRNRNCSSQQGATSVLDVMVGVSDIANDNRSDLQGSAGQLLGPVPPVALHGTAAQSTAAVNEGSAVALNVDVQQGDDGNYDGNDRRRNNSSSSTTAKAPHHRAPHDRAPFLVYKKPKGLRGFAITSLLMCTAVPCVVLLGSLVQDPGSLMAPGSDCTGVCAKRYVQLMYALCCMGLIGCYYSITVMLIGMGPVELLFVVSTELRQYIQMRRYGWA
jgi:hypothetical protein